MCVSPSPLNSPVGRLGPPGGVPLSDPCPLLSPQTKLGLGDGGSLGVGHPTPPPPPDRRVEASPPLQRTALGPTSQPVAPSETHGEELAEPESIGSFGRGASPTRLAWPTVWPCSTHCRAVAPNEPQWVCLMIGLDPIKGWTILKRALNWSTILWKSALKVGNQRRAIRNACKGLLPGRGIDRARHTDAVGRGGSFSGPETISKVAPLGPKCLCAGPLNGLRLPMRPQHRYHQFPRTR
jgi:hypothetical protein